MRISVVELSESIWYNRSLYGVEFFLRGYILTIKSNKNNFSILEYLEQLPFEANLKYIYYTWNVFAMLFASKFENIFSWTLNGTIYPATLIPMITFRIYQLFLIVLRIIIKSALLCWFEYKNYPQKSELPKTWTKISSCRSHIFGHLICFYFDSNPLKLFARR